MANRSIFVDNQSGVLRNLPPMDLIKSMQILFDEFEKKEVAKFQETYVDKYLEFKPKQMSLTADAIMGQYNFRIMASVLGNESKVPLRSTEGFSVWTHSIPRLGHAYPMKATTLRTLMSVLESVRTAPEAKVRELEKTFLNSVQNAYMGVKDTLDYIFLYALSHDGITEFTPDLNNPQGITYKIDYDMPAANQIDSPVVWNKTNSDAGNLDILLQLQDIVNDMSYRGIDCNEIMLSQELFSFICRDLNVRMFVYGGDKSHAVVTLDALNNTLAGLGIPQFHVIKRKVGIEVDGKSRQLNPWNGDNLVFVPSGKLGIVQPSIEDSDLIPEQNVSYIDSEEGIKISKWSVGDSTGEQPTEYTQAAGRLLPVIDQIKGIVRLKVKGFDTF